MVSGQQQKGWAGGWPTGNQPSDVREHPWPEREQQTAAPLGQGRLLTAEILEEVCRVAPADPLPQAGHVAT